jgi:dihydroorotate dehydrogenase (fumarate)
MRKTETMTMTDLSTKYLGLTLTSPFIAGASPLGAHLEMCRRLEDGGCAAIVLHSLFEEQISEDQTGRIRQFDRLDSQFAAMLSHFPQQDQYALRPQEYLEHVRRVKAAVRIPVIASLNGSTAESWLTFARLLEQAGADALELNMYEVVTDLDQSAMTVEHGLVQIIKDLKQELRIPLAVKLSPFFTAFGNVARAAERAGADGLVLFNRFLQPDIDLQHLAVWPHLELSTSAELLLRLRWLAILHGRVRCSLAATGGVATPEDGIKAILAGAHVVQMVSAILRHGPSYFGLMRDQLGRWMESLEFRRLEDVRGRLSLASTDEPSAFERAQYLDTLTRWSSWLGYQANLKAHSKDDIAS